LNNFDYAHIKDLIGQSRLIIVTSHHNPDGDAIGSTLAMAALLKKTGREAVVMVPNDYPGFLKWMPGNDEVIVYRHSKEKADVCSTNENTSRILEVNGTPSGKGIYDAWGINPAEHIINYLQNSL